LRLSSFEPSYTTSVYGIFAIRDNFDPRRNYVFNHSRDDAVTVQKQVIKACLPPKIIMLVLSTNWLAAESPSSTLEI
jgi:hypothetical protein